ncbi:MAG: hypothetical protein JWM58_3508 [Rhizobium sp.]|nr:hypothetical protein [Rhizobium sp.]
MKIVYLASLLPDIAWMRHTIDPFFCREEDGK